MSRRHAMLGLLLSRIARWVGAAVLRTAVALRRPLCYQVDFTSLGERGRERSEAVPSRVPHSQLAIRSGSSRS